ncbi:MAG: peptidylprolyl isomerase [Lachnospiraceae bacterium]|nr:peptidylprolyl isomerase [Lachnospiraceae bacterium]
MKKRTGKAVLAALIISCIGMTGCGKEEQSVLPLQETAEGDQAAYRVVLTDGSDTNEIFRIGRLSCSRAQAILYLSNMQERYSSIYSDGIWQRKIDGQSIEEKLKNITLSRLTQVKSMVLMADERGITLSDEDEAKVEQATDQYCVNLTPDVSNAGITREEVKTCFEEMAIADKVYQQIIQETQPEISDDEARCVTVSRILLKTYREDAQGNRIEFSEKERADTYQKALMLLSRLNQGEDFDQLAAANNEGDRITVSFGKGETEEAVEKAAFELGNDQLSSVVESSEGYLIMKCVQAFDRQQTDLRKEEIARRKKEESFLHIYEEFTKSQIRTINEEAWDSIRLDVTKQDKTENFFELYMKVFEQDQT